MSASASASASALNLLIIIIIFFFSSGQAKYSSLTLPIYSISQFYQVRVSDQVFVPIDTGDDVALFPCSPPTRFRTLDCFKDRQLCNLVQPTGCRTGCAFKRVYGKSNVTAILVQGDIARLDPIPMNNYTYGCVNKSTGGGYFPGLLGLGRGPLSLLNQTTSLYGSIFSYCLPTYNNFQYNGFLNLGPPTRQPKNIASTLLLQSKKRSPLYYAKLVGIAVNQKLVTGISKDAFEFNSMTGAGTFFDTGSMFTSLVNSAYNKVRAEVMRQMHGFTLMARPVYPFDTCYANVLIYPRVSSITFMFANNVNLTLPPQNFIINFPNFISCLAMTTYATTDPNNNNVNSNANIIASYQQQNKLIMIDVPNSKLSIGDVGRSSCYGK